MDGIGDKKATTIASFVAAGVPMHRGDSSLAFSGQCQMVQSGLNGLENLALYVLCASGAKSHMCCELDEIMQRE